VKKQKLGKKLSSAKILKNLNGTKIVWQAQHINDQSYTVVF